MVAINDFEIPGCCVDCPIYYDLIGCPITGTSTYKEIKRGFNDLKERMSDCPLVEVNE